MKSEKGAKPIVVKRGNVSVKIYSSTNSVNGANYTQHTVVYYQAGKRVRKKFASLEIAKTEAELAVSRLANADGEVLKLTAMDRSIYVQATEVLKPLQTPLNIAVAEFVEAKKMLPEGIPLNMAVSELMEARKMLPNGVSLKDAVSSYLKRNLPAGTSKTVPEVVKEMVMLKEQAGRGNLHLRDLTCRLESFANAFPLKVSDVSTAVIEDYLNGLATKGMSARTRLNHLRHIGALITFAIRRKYLPKEALDEFAAVERPDPDHTEIEIFTPNELQLMFDQIRQELVPWLAIAAFAGLRSAELQKLDWKEVDLESGYIEVSANKAKTASRRLVPITPNLNAWLSSFKKATPTGKVVPFDNLSNQIISFVSDLNSADPHGKEFSWKRNALRHSFISYRLAIIKDVGAVSIEAGNSPQMVFKNYRQLVTEQHARKWFEIAPEAGSNVIQLTPPKTSFRESSAL